MAGFRITITPFAVLSALAVLGLTILVPQKAQASELANQCGMISDTVVHGDISPAGQQNLASYRNACFACIRAGGDFYHDAGGGDIYSAWPGPLKGHCQARPVATNAYSPRGQGQRGASNNGGDRQRQIQDGLNSSNNTALQYLVDKEAERAQQAAEADADRQQQQAAAEARTAQRRAEEAVADANRRAGLCNAFDGSCARQAGDPSNPFSRSADATGGPTSASPDNPFAVASNAAANPFASPQPGAPLPGGGIQPYNQAKNDPPSLDRKLGEPSLANGRPGVTLSTCQTTPRGHIIALPNGRAYCVVEVDSPELTNDWYYLVDDPQPPIKSKPRPVSPTMGVRG